MGFKEYAGEEKRRRGRPRKERDGYERRGVERKLTDAIRGEKKKWGVEKDRWQ